MTKRLSQGVLFVAIVALLSATTVFAERPPAKEWKENSNNPLLLSDEVPVHFRASAGTTWVNVYASDGASACDDPVDTIGSQAGQSVQHVWCFEGANGDSTWPAVPGGQNTGSKKETYDHWSKFDPPLPPESKWHVSTRHTGPSTGTYNAWCGCPVDTTGNPAGPDDNGFSCAETAFWINKGGSGDDWNFPLFLDMSGEDASSGGTLEFDLRYDTECNYDYGYLEYLDTGTGEWTLMNDGTGDAIFNAVSGNPDDMNGGTGRSCGDDLYHHSDQKDLGGGNEPYYGNSIWLENVSFPLVAQAGGMQLRWRGFSDGAWSDADGRGETDGVIAIDNVSVTFTASGNVVSDDFETGDFNGLTVTQPGTDPIRAGLLRGGPSWTPGGLEGNTYDGWHLSFDPMYKNKGNTCFFSDDWMWASKPEVGSIPPSASGFSFFLVSPVIDSDGWTGAVVEYDQYLCMEDSRDDFINTHVRVYDTNAGAWSIWNDIDGFITFAGCDFWSAGGNVTEDLTPFITASVDSLQFAWETLDISSDGTFQWGKHGGVQHLIDRVSFGSFDGTSTQFTSRVIDIFADTFSRSDPAHTPFLQNPEQGNWEGIGGTRTFADSDSLNVEITDFNGVTASNVVLRWRHDDGGAGFGAWNSKTMDFALPDPQSTSDEGTYRQIIGADDGSVEDAEGTSGNGLIWKAGTTVEYYVEVTDNIGSTAQFLTGLGNPFEFSVLPFGKTTPNGNKILLVDDYTRANALDFEKSSGFNPSGGIGFGGFAGPVLIQPDVLVEEALGLIYGSDFQAGAGYVDRYDVQGGGTSVQCEPRGVSDLTNGVGGYMSDIGVPNYDALIWLQGTFDAYSYADTTRLDLITYIENGGHFLSTGDQVNFHLGTAGNNADSTIGFIGDYLGTSFPSAIDEETDNRVIDIEGEAGSEYAGVLCAIYGECPIRRTFDRLTLATPAVLSENRVLLNYANSTANDNAKEAAIYNQRFADAGHTNPQGDAINFAFGLETLPSRVTIAMILDIALHDVFGMTDPGYDATDVPGINVGNGFAFQLAAAAPNPFRSSTEISFSVAKRTHVEIEVFNILGQKVRTLVNEPLDPNSYVRSWDGRSDEGTQVSSGIYFYKMVAGDFSDTKKAVLLK